MPSADALDRQAAARKNKLSTAASNIWNVKPSANAAGAKALYGGIGSSTVKPAAPDNPPDNPPGNPYSYVEPAVAAAPAAQAAPDTSVETLTKTAEYMARERAMQAAMDLFTANQATESARYNEGYGKSLRDLGYDATTGFDRGALMSSGQRATESGRAYNAMGDDFAARGMLQSGAYQAKQGVLGTQLEDQRTAIDTAKVRFGEDQTAKLTAQKQANEAARVQALAEAKAAVLERYAMGA